MKTRILKELSALMIAELEIESKFAGKVWAYVPVTNGSSFIGLGVATANEAGYTPVPLTFCHSDSWEAMVEHSDALNAARGVSVDEAARTVCSSMAAGPVVKAALAQEACTYPKCRCIVRTSTSQPIPDCRRGLEVRQ